jgi:hypothetical protein
VGDRSDQALGESVVQPSNGTKKTAPEESAAVRAVHIGEKSAAPFISRSLMIDPIYRVSDSASVPSSTSRYDYSAQLTSVVVISCSKGDYMMPATTLPRDDEECRLFGVYEVSSVKEHAVASKLLNPHHGLSDPAYIKLLVDLRAIRMECNEAMLAIIAHCKKKRELLTVH